MDDLELGCLPCDVKESNCVLDVCCPAASDRGTPRHCLSLVAPSPVFVFCSLVPLCLLQQQYRNDRAKSQNNPVSSPVLQTNYVMCWTSSTRKKKKTYKKQSNFSKQSKHTAHGWLHLAHEKICTCSGPRVLTVAPASLSCSRPPGCLG